MASMSLGQGEDRMSVGERRISWPRRVFCFAILIPLVGVRGTASEPAGPEPAVLTTAALAVGYMQSKLVKLEPGLLIGDKAPEGWSHLVIKSIPRLASGDVDNLPNDAAKTAAYFRTVMLANVKPVDVDEKEFELTQIGIGICVPRKGQDKDIVVAADRLEALGLHLSFVRKTVLDTMEAEMAEGVIIARTPTFAILRSPATVVDGNKHRKVDLNYAFCVDRTTGKLQVGLWMSAMEKRDLRPPNEMVRVKSRSDLRLQD